MPTRHCNVIDLSKAPYTEYGAGVKRGNPGKCVRCGKAIKPGETWRKEWSAEDPQFGRYAVIVHSPNCPDQGAFAKFQEMLKAA